MLHNQKVRLSGSHSLSVLIACSELKGSRHTPFNNTIWPAVNHFYYNQLICNTLRPAYSPLTLMPAARCQNKGRPAPYRSLDHFILAVHYIIIFFILLRR